MRSRRQELKVGKYIFFYVIFQVDNKVIKLIFQNSDDSKLLSDKYIVKETMIGHATLKNEKK